MMRDYPMDTQNDHVVLQQALLHLKNFRHNESILRGRNGLALVNNMLRNLLYLLVRWDDIQHEDRLSFDSYCSDHVSDAAGILVTVNFRGEQALQMSCIETAAVCALHMIKFGLVDSFARFFSAIFPSGLEKEACVHVFFQHMDIYSIESQTQLDNIEVWDGYDYPIFVLQYTNRLLAEGLFDHLLREFERSQLSDTRGSNLLEALSRLVRVLPIPQLLRARESNLRILLATVSSDSHDLRKIFNNILDFSFQLALLLDRRVKEFSVNELGRIGLLLLKSTLLDKRMLGSACLNGLCKDVVVCLPDASFDCKVSALRQLLISNGILDLLFGPSMHGEVSKLKRCNHIIRVIFQGITDDPSAIESASFLWGSLFDRHSDMFEVCYEAFKLAIRVFPVDVISSCLQLMLSTSNELINARPRTLGLLAHILDISDLDLAVKKGFADSILQHLLHIQLFHCDDPAFAESAELAKTIIVAHPFDEATALICFKRICDQCILVLQNPSNRSCKILDFLLEFFSKIGDESWESELTDVLCHVLGALSSHCVLDGYSVSMFSFLSHASIVRLLGLAQEDMLWRALAIDSAEEGRRQQAFEFLLQSTTLNMDVQKFILQTRFPALPSSCMSLKALECLLHLIKCVNTPERRARVGTKRERSESSDFTILPEVFGFDTLWKFCLHCSDPNVLRKAVFNFSSYTAESGRSHPEIFQSVVQNCFRELKCNDVGFVKARNIISVMLDMSRCVGSLWNDAFPREKYRPLGLFVDQPHVLVIIYVESNFQSGYFSPLLTVQQFRAEIVVKLKISFLFHLVFEVPNCDGQLECVHVEDDSHYLVRYGPSISCKIIAVSCDEGSAGPSRASMRDIGGTKPATQHTLSRPDSHIPPAQPPMALRHVAAPARLAASVPIVRVPFDIPAPTHVASNSSQNDCESHPSTAGGERTSNACWSNLSETLYPWSIFTEDADNYLLLFRLATAVPDLNLHIWELLLLLPVNVDFISQILSSSSQPSMYFSLNSTMEKIYFLSCISVWQKLSFCFSDQPTDSEHIFSSNAVAALDMPDALLCSISAATCSPHRLLESDCTFGSLLLSYHLGAIYFLKMKTSHNLNLNCLSYYLVLHSAGIIGLSRDTPVDALDDFIESINKQFAKHVITCSLDGHSVALADAAMRIILHCLTQVDSVLTWLSCIPSPRRKNIVRLLLYSCCSTNLFSNNEETSRFTSFQHQLLATLLSSTYQFEVFAEIIDFIQNDSSLFSDAVNLFSLYMFFKKHGVQISRNIDLPMDTLFQSSGTVLACMNKCIQLAKRKRTFQTSKLLSFYLAESFILRLMIPTEVSSHCLLPDCVQRLCEILELAAFPHDVTFLPPDVDASHDVMMDVLSPRPLSLVSKKPLCSNDEDSYSIELGALIQDALMKLPGLPDAVFQTMLKNSKLWLMPQASVSPPSSISKCGKFHGIYNLGCTCYFNSITQQLFMIPGFAASVIAAQTETAAQPSVEQGVKVTGSESKAASEPNVLARGILGKFQELMISLRHGSDPVVYPKSFCDAFRFPDGSSILPDVQQDALEYFHILCDHLDNALKAGHDEKLLARFFGGRIATQLLCKGCPHRYERFEQFFTLQLPVFSNRPNSVPSSLQEFVSGELLEGDNQYFCSQCSKKVDTVKRTVLADLPDTIIIGLKRFDFNYDSMQRIKLNVEVPFSHDLDMMPFCRENLGDAPEDSEPVTQRDRSYYEYSLVGFVVHVGMADSGHYYSIIRDPEDTDLWHKFNDDVVTPIQNLELKQFFGGQSYGKSAHASAYILVYHRKSAIFSHPYEQIFSIENAVEQVQTTLKLSAHSMFVDAFKSKSLWQCFNYSIQCAFGCSDDGSREIAYLEMIMTLSACSSLDSVASVEAFSQPLLVSLRSIGKCDLLLRRLFLDSDDPAAVQSTFFNPISDVDSKQLPVFSPLHSHLLTQVFPIISDFDRSRFTPEESAAYCSILGSIIRFYGNILFSLFHHFPLSSPHEVHPVAAPLAFAVQAFLQHSWKHGLGDIVAAHFASDPQLEDAVAVAALHRICLVSAHFAHLSESGPKLRSKRRAHLRKLVQDSRYRASWNCLTMLKFCFLEQTLVAQEALLAHSLWIDCFQTLFTSDFLVNYLYAPVTPLVSEILSMFYDLAIRTLPLMPPLAKTLLEVVHEFAGSPVCSSYEPQLTFCPGLLANLIYGLICFLGGNSQLILNELLSSVVSGFAESFVEDDDEQAHHAYRMMIVIVTVDSAIQQMDPALPIQNSEGCYAPQPTRDQFRRFLSYLASKPHPPCFDDGKMYSASEARSAALFSPVLVHLQRALDAYQDSASAVVSGES